ncbi:hypothetical protein B0I35DRAFT_420109 [Stachybotrys elegans]|uniref:N-acetyltransferase domain-containing protein n=1 Tax=Stachybotrys elegans TaxID=80388 RepID=A0A8K0T0C3_9HYPO|nr:hypothetical protein B0I35DRAFT_420109 [Stachybotrys elegans]
MEPSIEPTNRNHALDRACASIKDWLESEKSPARQTSWQLSKENVPPSKPKPVSVATTAAQASSPTQLQSPVATDSQGASGQNIPRLGLSLSTNLKVMQAAMKDQDSLPAMSECGHHPWSMSDVTEAPADFADYSVEDLVFSDVASDANNSPTALRERAELWKPRSSDGLTSIVTAWLSTLSKNPVISLVSPESQDYIHELCNCDFDTETGLPIPAVQLPDTMPRPVLGPCRDAGDVAWRAQNMSSTLALNQEIERRQAIADRLRRKIQYQEEEMKAATEVTEIQWPNAKCLIRPATTLDFPRLVEIINLEVQSKPFSQIPAKEPFGLPAIERLYHDCKATLRPFIVAETLGEDFTDRSKWPKDSDDVYAKFVKLHKSTPSEAPVIVGFAFVTDSQIGFLNASSQAFRFSGQVKLIVHPDHRQRSYGTALMDRVLQTVGPYFQSVIDYTWECESPGHIYEFPPTANRRQYTSLRLELFSEEGKGPESTWMNNMLEKFNFEQVATFPRAGRTIQGHPKQWLDLSVWQLRVRPFAEIEEVDY